LALVKLRPVPASADATLNQKIRRQS